MRKIQDALLLRRFMDKHRLSGLFDKKTEALMELYAFDKGEIVYLAEGRAEHLFMLVQGRVKIYRVLPNGKSILIRFYQPLSTIGDLEMLGELSVKSTVESVNETLFIGIQRQALLETACEDAAFLRFIIQSLAHKLHTFSTSSSLNLLYPVETRFAGYLLSITDEQDRALTEEIKTGKLTEIAELLGTSYRHLNRVISRFVREGWVERSRGSLYVKDRARLEQLANGISYH
ncbi:cyclic nucleotide-binding domain-containing protein [Cohnella boryungensis]|uniref:Cyclic nucleotide-binding domain-containing protein n=1 Tax=Cohnella boryungensis TaxID=768479 RepID=A0ABV8S434_9BACL